MGCLFSKEEALSFRKKKKMPKIPNHRHGLERIPTFQSVRPAKNQAMRKRPMPSEGAQHCNIYENIPQEYSTLAFLAGGKNFQPEDMIFQKVLPGPVTSQEPAATSQVQVQEVRQVQVQVQGQGQVQDEVQAPAPATVQVSAPTIFMPDCLSYKGQRKDCFRMHLFVVDSERFRLSPGCAEHILDAIQRIKRWGWVMVVYKHPDNDAALLPWYDCDGIDLFNSLCSRFNLRLRRIIIFKPSWHVQKRLEEQAQSNDRIFCRGTMKKMSFVFKQQTLAKWTGFPEMYGDAKM